jgi:hypothetical protein
MIDNYIYVELKKKIKTKKSYHKVLLIIQFFTKLSFHLLPLQITRSLSLGNQTFVAISKVFVYTQGLNTIK